MKLSRRRFLRTATRAGALIAAPSIVPPSVLGLNGAVPPSEQIVLGGIGLGRRGGGVLNWMLGETDVRFVANCDVQKSSRERIANMVNAKYGNTDCALYDNMEAFLAERADTDALLIATGDRWHATASILAMRAGKDVFCEKPSSMTVAEGRAVVDTARRYGRIFQTGTQRLSEPNHIFAIEMARTGRLGRIHTVYAHIAGRGESALNNRWLPEEPLPPKEEVDWDAWLGPSPWRPFNSQYIAGRWHGQFDFHTGSIGEWGSHTFAQALAGIDPPPGKPIRFEYTGSSLADGMKVRFANGVTMVLAAGFNYWRGACGERFDGDDGWAAAADGYSQPDVSSPALLGEYRRVLGEYTARTGRALSHVRNFFDCVKNRQPPVMNAEAMHRSMNIVHAANFCMWLQRDIVFDPRTETVVDDPQANRMLARAARQPYAI